LAGQSDLAESAKAQLLYPGTWPKGPLKKFICWLELAEPNCLNRAFFKASMCFKLQGKSGYRTCQFTLDILNYQTINVKPASGGTSMFNGSR
jgi:hypothetical protein